MLEETARAKAVAELQRGAARGARHFLYVDVGTAIGAGIVIDGQPLRASRSGRRVGACHGRSGGRAVPLRQSRLYPGHGLRPRAGRPGARVALARRLLSLSDREETLTLADIAAAADRGDKMALGLLTEAGERLGEAISMALNLLGFDLVVLGGALARCSPVVLEAVTRIVRLRVLPIVPCERRLVHGIWAATPPRAAWRSRR